MKVLRWIGNSFIVLGATLLFFVVYELYGTSFITNHHQQVLAETFDASLPHPAEAPSGSKPAAKPVRYTGPPIVARMIIPKIGLDKIAVQGTSLYALAYGPGHYLDTPLPGRPGTTAFACHRTGWGSPCINLDKVGPGDEVIFETKDGCKTPPCRFVYKITHVRQVEAGDGWVLKGDPTSTAKYKLTLTTCTPKYTSLHRLIFWGDLVSAPYAAT
jgi:sortase A